MRITMDQREAQDLAADYGPLLDALQRAIESAIGPLTWSPRADAAEAIRHDGSHALRIGAINALGVPTAELDPPALSRIVNEVIGRWGFPAQPAMTGSASGHLVCEAVDDRGAEFTLLVRSAVDAWVDQPL